MHKAMRRAFGVGGATAVAIAASLALAGVADAHTPIFSTPCLDNGNAALTVNLKYYSQPKTSSETNTITISYTPNGGKAQQVLAVTDFGSTYPSNGGTKQFPVDGTTAGTFTITITAWDDEPPAVPATAHSVAEVGPDAAWDGTWTKTTKVCPQPSTPTTVPPSTKPTVPSQPSTPPSSGSTTTTAPAVAPVANQTPPSGGLAYTGVSATLPLIIAGALIIIGAAALIGMRIMKRRRAES
jgi:hypothetical protein